LALLGLRAGADRNAITRAYRRLARRTHPDRSDAADASSRFDDLTAAYRRALEAAPRTAVTAATAPPRASEVAPTRGSDVVVSAGAFRLRGPTIIVGPVRVDPTPTGRRRRDW